MSTAWSSVEKEQQLAACFYGIPSHHCSSEQPGYHWAHPSCHSSEAVQEKIIKASMISFASVKFRAELTCDSSLCNELNAHFSSSTAREYLL